VHSSGHGFVSVTARTVVVHTVTYFLAGLLALVLLRYDRLFATAGLSGYMRPTDDPWVLAGPLLQPLRGLVLGSVVYLLREPIFERRQGWAVLWWMLVGVGILSTFGPAPGSIEGLIYTRVPWRSQLVGLPEGLVQSLALSVVLVWWVRHPRRRWANWLLGVLFALVVALPILGLAVRGTQPG
jgi:hypothetical protein